MLQQVVNYAVLNSLQWTQTV